MHKIAVLDEQGADGKPVGTSVQGDFSITTPADADQFMNDLDAAFVKAFPELMEGHDIDDTDDEHDRPQSR
jgi:hypothetical protein